MRVHFLLLGGVKEVCSDDTALALNMEDALMIKKSLRISDVVEMRMLTNTAIFQLHPASPKQAKSSCTRQMMQQKKVVYYK